MRRNPAATQGNNLAAILQYEDEVTLYLIDTSTNRVVGLLSIIDSSGVSERLITYVGLAAAAKLHKDHTGLCFT